jgi:hypothetical protein
MFPNFKTLYKQTKHQNLELHIKQILPVIEKEKDTINKTTGEEIMLGFEC